jgi:hypothetical protein
VTLSAGTRLGSYEILSPLGAGGMGEVYRARDPRLGREVAIKILPASFSQDPDRLRRFEQEARAAGILNHPNITAVYDVGSDSSSGAPYVVQELLEGETLRDELAGGRFSIRRTIDVALQIARGLAAAHEKGIVHRDLKPENVFVTKDGRVKILDFGLAKLTQTESGSGPQTDMPTASAGTEPGVVMGTLGYMSPEQVRGRPTDARSDLFAFGAILYEMVSGRRAFTGDSAADTMSAILKEDPPDLSSTGPHSPPGLERIVRHCLEKSPERRFHSAHDVAFALETMSGIASPSAAGEWNAAGSRRLPWTPILASLAAVALGAALILARARGRSEPPVFRPLTFRRGLVESARFAPDGQSVVYSAAWEGREPELYQARAGLAESLPLKIANAGKIAGITAAGEMAVLLTGRTAPTLARVPITGGAPREMAENVSEADISRDGRSVALVRFLAGSTRLEYPSGKTIYQTGGDISYPRISPDGERVAFFDHPLIGDDRGSVAVVDRTGRKNVLTPEWSSTQGLAWSPSGGEIWFTASEHGSNLEVRGCTLSGKRRRILSAPSRLILRDVAPDGRLLLEKRTLRRALMCLPPGETQERDLSWLDLTNVSGITRDGSLLLLGESGEGGGESYSVYVRKTDGSPAVRLGDGFPDSFTYDEKSVLALIPGPKQRLVVLPIGAGEPRTLPDYGYSVRTAFFLPDGRRMLLVGIRPGQPLRIFDQAIAGGAPRPFGPDAIGAPPVLSPDGKWAFVVRADDKAFLYPTEGGEPREVPAYRAGEWPASISGDGRSLSLYLYALRGFPVQTARVDLATGTREPWREFAPPDATSRDIRGLVVSADGRSYAYVYSRSTSELYLVEGVQ